MSVVHPLHGGEFRSAEMRVERKRLRKNRADAPSLAQGVGTCISWATGDCGHLEKPPGL